MSLYDYLNVKCEELRETDERLKNVARNLGVITDDMSRSELYEIVENAKSIIEDIRTDLY